jgi:hypothetical protein
MNIFELSYLMLGTSSLLITNIAHENHQIHIAMESIQDQAYCPSATKGVKHKIAPIRGIPKIFHGLHCPFD